MATRAGAMVKFGRQVRSSRGLASPRPPARRVRLPSVPARLLRSSHLRHGVQLETDRRPEWEEGYVDYKKLKKTLKEMITSGHCQLFDENSVYAPISVATSEETLKPKGPHEHDFMLLVDNEIDKVNKFTAKLREELDARVHSVQADHDAWIAAGAAESSAASLRLRVDECSK